ncbi:zinc finger AN1 domain-containingstress-associated protein 12 [Striga asiatica]|uniref:Zinc finger AN1 domain-containingstress-associated protein 12 n=1 Tax=Striga asiatica TaxID=4170 RepID=A0A5A7RG24_STRAF|nr:zinc finger AN1 domain-containingstress-associated protein 12 [Striga asiatica]
MPVYIHIVIYIQLIRSHNYPNSDAGSQNVRVCEICSSTVETTDATVRMRRRFWRGTRSGVSARKKKKLICSVPRCRRVLKFSNTTAYENCWIKICLRHWFSRNKKEFSA